jgi:hypothetical protein
MIRSAWPSHGTDSLGRPDLKILLSAIHSCVLKQPGGMLNAVRHQDLLLYHPMTVSCQLWISSAKRQ